MTFKEFIKTLSYEYKKRHKIFINLRIDGEYVNTVDVTIVKEHIKNGENIDYYDYELEKWYHPGNSSESFTVCLKSKQQNMTDYEKFMKLFDECEVKYSVESSSKCINIESESTYSYGGVDIEFNEDGSFYGFGSFE